MAHLCTRMPWLIQNDKYAGFAHPGLVVFDVASNERNIIGQHGCHFVYHNPVSVHVLISQDTRPAGTDDGSSDMGGSVSGLGANMCVDIAFCAEFPERAPFVVVGLMSSSAVVPVYAKCVTRRGFTICNPNDVAVDVSYMIVGTIKHK